MTSLHVYEFGPADGPVVVGLHGLTGHGKRWHSLATNYLPDVRFFAPDLRGHGRSTWAPPWNLDTVVDDVIELIETLSTPVLLVGHSFGGAIALELSQRAPHLLRGLLLLDPAIGIDPQRCLELASLAVRYPTYASRDEARNEKLADWDGANPVLVDREIADHLIEDTEGRLVWRICTPAVGAYFGELSRPLVLPPSDLAVTLVHALRSEPPWVTPELRQAFIERGELVEIDCVHSVPVVAQQQVADLIHNLLGRM